MQLCRNDISPDQLNNIEGHYHRKSEISFLISLNLLSGNRHESFRMPKKKKKKKNKKNNNKKK